MAGRLSSWADSFILVAAAHVFLAYGKQYRRSFVIDYENNCFPEGWRAVSDHFRFYALLQNTSGAMGGKTRHNEDRGPQHRPNLSSIPSETWEACPIGC
uniref:Putative beta-galactosidase n=1 Tax=Ixodes ricinus TaxID=34613 RepID=A0A090XC47_IXORI